MQTPAQIYVSIDGKNHGPYSHPEVRQYLATGQLQPQMLAWGEGMTDWQPLGSFPEFAAQAAQVAQVAATGFVRPRHRSRAGLYISLALCAVALCAVAGWLVWQHGTQPNWLVAAPKPPGGGSTNWPKSLAELDAWYVKPPAGQNAAEIFMRGFDALAEPISTFSKNTNLPLIGSPLGSAPVRNAASLSASFRLVTLPSPASPVPDNMKTAIAAFLEQTKPASDLFKQASRLPQSRYPIDLTNSGETLLPHLEQVQKATRASAVIALGYADTKRGKEAGESLLIGFGLGRSLQDEPLMISQSTRQGCNLVTQDALEQTLNRVALPSQTLAWLQEVLGHLADREAGGESINRALAGEKVILLAASIPSMEEVQKKFDSASPEDLKDLEKGLASMGVTNSGTLKERLISALKQQAQQLADGYDQVLAARKAPFPERLKAVEPCRQTDANATSREASDLAHLRLDQTAVALERFRAAKGDHYPDTLAELSPKFLPSVPEDPFDGQPLRYAKSGNGYTLHSIGTPGAAAAALKTLSFAVSNPPKP